MASVDAQPRDGPRTAACPYCNHRFLPGAVMGHIYCSRCGGRFHPNAALNETVALVRPPPPAADEAGDEASDAPAVPPPDAASRRGAAAVSGGDKEECPGRQPNDPDSSPSRRWTGNADADDASRGGERFGDYDLLEEIARGGMGVVYRAWQRSLRRVVALKLLRAGDDAGPAERERLLREASAAAGLSHPNIVPVHEFSVFQGRPYFTMDLIEGEALDRRLENGPLAPMEACRLIEAAARAIDYAHRRGIVHRDLKPANIIIDSGGEPRVTDFGLAARLGPDPTAERMTQAGSIMGTIPYIPPEQAAGRVDSIDERSDVYSLGAVLYESVTGRPPFSGDTQFELLRRVIHQEPVPPRRLSPRLHRDVETIILTCLEKEPGRRYPGAGAMADDCRAFLRGEVIHARPTGRAFKLWRWLSRRKTLAALLLALFLLLGMFGQIRLLWRDRHETERELQATLEERTRLAGVVREAQGQLRRHWREDFALDFAGGFQSMPTPVEARLRTLPWRDPRRAIPAEDGALRLTAENRDNPRPSFGLPLPYPHDFRLSLAVKPPESGEAGLIVWVDADRGFQAVPASTRIDLGALAALRPPSSGAPDGGDRLPPSGARLSRGGVELGGREGFAWNPNASAELVVERVEGSWSVKVDGIELLALAAPAMTEYGEGYIAFAGAGAGIALGRVSVWVKGLSAPILESMLEFGRTMLAQGETGVALPLYERVAWESTDPAMHLRALRGLAQACAGERRGNPALAAALAEELAGKRPPNTPEAPGENQYFAGLAAMAGVGDDRISVALGKFADAAREGRSRSPALSFAACQIAGPFLAPGAAAPLAEAYQPESNPDALAYAVAGKTLAWEPLGAADRQGEEIACPPSGRLIDDAVYYARRVFHASEAFPATLRVEAAVAPGVWFNGAPLASIGYPSAIDAPSPTAVSAPGGSSAETGGHDLIFTVTAWPGENIVLLKFPADRPGYFRLRLSPDGGRHAGLYGQLALLESAILRWRHGDAGAAGDLAALRADGTLLQLRENRLGDSLAELAATLLDLADRQLRRIAAPGASETPSNPQTMAEEVRAGLSGAELLTAAAGDLGADARDVAQRFRQAGAAWGAWSRFIAGASARSDAAFAKTRELAVDWIAPWADQAALAVESGDPAAVWSQAKAALPKSPELRLAISRFWLDGPGSRHRDPARALAAAEEAVALGGGAAAHEARALALWALGRLKDAERAVDEGLSIKPMESLLGLRREIRRQLEILREAPETPLPLPPPPGL